MAALATGAACCSVDGASLSLHSLMLSGGAIAQDNSGAVLVVNGSLQLEQVAATGNRARNGGGIMAHASSVTIRASAITDNRAHAAAGAEGNGGGVHLRNSSLAVQNSTFGGNQAKKGGAIVTENGTAALQNVTIVGNSAGVEGGGVHSVGDGVTLLDTILASNGAADGPACFGRFTSGGHNLLDDLESCTILGQTASNVIIQEQAWVNLARTFADTYAYDLFPASPAVNAGRCELTVDQRGAARPAGGGCDIGAIEYDPLAGLTVAAYLPIVGRSGQ